MFRGELVAWRAGVALVLLAGGCDGAIVLATDATRGDSEGRDAARPLATSDAGAGSLTRTDSGIKAGPPGSGASGGVSAPLAVCDAPIASVDVSRPTTVVGTGDGTCSEELLAAALKKGGVITFDCGENATITVTKELGFATGVDTTLDGEGRVTLDGQGKTRILSFNGPDFQKTTTKLTVQRLHFVNGKATGTKMFAQASAPCSQGYQDGGGGALYVRDADLRILDSTFTNNESASPGPDVAGGAVYAVGTIAATIVGSVFRGNQGANGGAVGALWGNLSVYNSTFSANRATGSGANSINDSCPEVEGQRETGSGGNGGAIVMDGGEKFSVVICGSTFTHNVGGDGAFGGAVFRTPDVDVQSTTIDRCSFDGNESGNGGALYFHHSKLTIDASTFADNVGRDGTGGIQVDDSDLTIRNSTFENNRAMRAPGGTGPRGGAITHYGNTGTLTNCTFMGNMGEAASNAPAAGAIFGASKFSSISNTLFSGNDSACDSTAQGQHDLEWPSGDTPCVQGIATMDPQLGSMEDNGGPTETCMPATTSPAKAAGALCPKTDQRGYARASACTIGAVEMGASAP